MMLTTRVRTAAFVVTAIGVIPAAFAARLAGQERPPADEGIGSPHVAALAKDLAAGNPTALATFWQDLRGKASLVEPVVGDARSSWVTFVWRGTPETRRVSLVGGPPDGQPHQWLTCLADTDLWYRTERLPN